MGMDMDIVMLIQSIMVAMVTGILVTIMDMNLAIEFTTIQDIAIIIATIMAPALTLIHFGGNRFGRDWMFLTKV